MVADQRRFNMNRRSLFLLLLCVVLLFLGNSLNGQELGAKFGLARSHADISQEIPGVTFQSMTDFSVGIFLPIDIIGGQLGLQPEVNYIVKGFDVREMDQGEEVSSKYKISYIEVPVLIYYKAPLKGNIKPGVFFGPYVGFAQKATEVQTAFGDTEKRDVGDNLKGQDFGLMFGGNVGYRVGSLNLLLDIRYSIGFNNISQDIMDVAYEFQEDDKIKNRSLLLSLGVGFNLSNK
jgi:hypothetical protein